MTRQKISVVLAVLNEEQNLDRGLNSVKNLADEIIVADQYSTDDTVEIAKSYGAKVYEFHYETNFHITKQKAIDKATGEWILQLDADEVVTPDLAKEIKSVLTDRHAEFISESVPKRVRGDKERLFRRHEGLIRQREGALGSHTGEVVAFFIPRLNYFLGKPLIHAGVYPDGVIRLFKKGKARLPGKSVHELMEVDGEVGWLFHDLEHHDSPTLRRYLERMNRYTDLHAQDLKDRRVPKNAYFLILYTLYKPALTFVSLYVRHRGFMDGIRGFLWSTFSSLHYPISYFKYWSLNSKRK
ncbi:hypothetical protein A3A76_03780 [Candidatus Woesebacteria bacterium RIFCSPLOWO2_01_FULL_39_23]|uniref:Glycosyltransferase 2-like domain-containing protein n=1 Tax=Candidatus Woesebacteria bacterium RIFCSPHIGHO2_01_FULL_40_22 TaxID=1802499 RepID=A0A1F7YJV2_9BACT|nr:MAG: hypothetical protein A2141_00245 [Candidatus Woesebacteria bacterium RBG_16_40_11]OGM27573.1 MAG: hypothetical protein A2628_02180 [Candidatus Woesebacteria bacterium RIFCSPHIGHO2_01_FULL_40_22]OGM36727.1 MAG: hypothetical protein A3E41_03025 [Candidatus Woesebacteria bacterium RIFCSPHIGHO2_12_FULL_38_9]OGM62747.1 MAG: hypothetical protein A3A76_03780 [Candidatus Woesebacteria bacterium RIFCSPLOWO2_01_FULL_39_23]